MSLQDLTNLTVPTNTQLNSIIKPTIIYTTDYLNNPIQFPSDPRFLPIVLSTQFEEIPSVIGRDFAQFAQIDVNDDDTQYLTINMYSPLSDPQLFSKTFSNQESFTQLGITK